MRSFQKRAILKTAHFLRCNTIVYRIMHLVSCVYKNITFLSPSCLQAEQSAKAGGPVCPWLEKHPLSIKAGDSIATCPILKSSKCPYLAGHKTANCPCFSAGECPHLRELAEAKAIAGIFALALFACLGESKAEQSEERRGAPMERERMKWVGQIKKVT
jgi:hypothetical protein